MITKPKHLYLHVPFCRTICAYCDFCHVGYQETVANRWLDAIKADIQNRHLNENLETIYIGGGTPTALSSSQLDLMDIVKEFRKCIKAMSDTELDALLASVRPLREHSISVDEYLSATESHVSDYQYTFDFLVSDRTDKDLALAA